MEKKIKTIGSTRETFCSVKGISLEWTISEFSALSSPFSSPQFKCCNETWYFIMYPEGYNTEEHVSGYISIELSKVDSETPSRIPMQFTLGFTLDSTLKEVLRDQGFPANCDFVRVNKFLHKTKDLCCRVQRNKSDILTITCTLLVDEGVSKDGDFEMIQRGDGSFREEMCSSHKHVVWSVDYDRLREYGVTGSPSFNIDNQWYSLKFQISMKRIQLILFRKGPCDDSVIYWQSGLKRSDGNYNYSYRNDHLFLKHNCDFWTNMQLLCVLYSDMEKDDLLIDRRITFFLRMDVKEAATAETCTHDAVERPVESNTTIREDECPSHKYVEWYVNNEGRLKVVTSPEFVIGTQRYKLKLKFKCSNVKNQTPVSLSLISWEPSIAASSQSVRWCAGVIRKGKTFNYYNEFGRLDLKEERDAWTQKLLHSDAFVNVRTIGRFTVFFRIDVGTQLSTSTVCRHDFPATEYQRMYQRSRGRIRQYLCSHHWHIEWKYLKIPLFRDTYMFYMSPLFHIGVQRYRLQLKMVHSRLIQLNLYSRRPPKRPSRPVRWWAGFRHPKGTYLNSSASGILDPGDLYEIWTHKCLLTVDRDDITTPVIFQRTLIPTVFFRINLERPKTETKPCSHIGASEMLPSQSRTTPKVQCIKNRQFEDILHTPDRSIDDLSIFTSRQFDVGTQRFYFQLVCTLNQGFMLLNLNLYSRGPADTGRPPSARWWAGLKRNDGTYYHRNLRGELALKEVCTLWTLRGSQQFVYSKFTSDLLSSFVPQYTVFFRLSEEEQYSNAATEYIPGIVEISPKLDFGNIERQECASYTQVKWTVLYDPQEGQIWNSVSDQFTIGTQLYKLELSQDMNFASSIILCLYRLGSSVTCSSGLVQWWAGLKRGNGTYHYKNQRGELDLKENCELWTQIYLHRVCRYRLIRQLLTPDNHFTVFFRLGKEQKAAAYSHSRVVPRQNFKRLRREDNSKVVFNVKGKEFEVSRTIFEHQFPVFNAMFLHDTTERRTGVASIEDVEPDVFQELLHYVPTGFVQKLTGHNACGLYAVADKYLIEDLKPQCLQYVSATLSVETFFDVVVLALRYGEDDLMKEAVSFLSRNINITKTDTWQKFCVDNPETAKELQMRALLSVNV